MIKELEKRDIPFLIDLGYKMQQEGNFKNLDYDRKKMKNLFDMLISNPNFKCFVSENDKECTGMIMGYVSTYIFSNQKYASDLLLYIDPEKRGGFSAVRLIKTFEKWAKSKGAKEMRLGSTVGVNKELIKRLYEKLKYEVTGHTFRKVLGGSK